jgi:dihydrofolate synthase/folylpolyglutamate synthase
MDYIILEAGLGGEFDSTTAIKKDLLIVTPIGYDHQSFLGNTIKKIATTKLKAINSPTVIGFQNYNIVYKIAKKINNNRYKLYLLKEHSQKNNNFLKDNLSLAKFVAKILGVKHSFKNLDSMFGRFTKLNKNIIIDVGHNRLGASAIKKNLKNKKINLIYNSLNDKDYTKILKILKPVIKCVYIININDKRAIKKSLLKKALKKLNIKYKRFKTIKPNKKYLVFGSFKVVQEFLKVR